MSSKPVQAQAYYGTPVSGQRQTAVAAVHVQAGGVPFESPEVEVTAKPARKQKRG